MRISYNAPVVLSFALISFISLILGFLTKGKSTSLLFSVYRCSPASPLAYLRLFTHVLGHANLTHFFSNMTLFLVVGPILEEKYGSKMMLFCFLVTALVTGLLHVLISSHTQLLGASGLVFMMIIMASLSGMKEGELPMTLILVACMYLSKEIYAAVFVHDNVANLTHIAGGVCGFFLGMGCNAISAFLG